MYKCTFARRLTDGSSKLLMKAVCVRAGPSCRGPSVSAVTFSLAACAAGERSWAPCVFLLPLPPPSVRILPHWVPEEGADKVRGVVFVQQPGHPLSKSSEAHSLSLGRLQQMWALPFLVAVTRPWTI